MIFQTIDIKNLPPPEVIEAELNWLSARLLELSEMQRLARRAAHRQRLELAGVRGGPPDAVQLPTRDEKKAARARRSRSAPRDRHGDETDAAGRGERAGGQK